MSLKLNKNKNFQIAYNLREPKASHESQPYIVYLGGLMSSMQGTKATLLDAWAERQGVGYLRFDYRGHGESSGEFTDFGPDHWIEDAVCVIEDLVPDKAVIIGSSLGGWVGAGVAKEIPHKISGFMGIAAAPDFVDRDFTHRLSEAQLEQIARGEIVELASDYPEPYRISRALIDGGRKAAVLSSPLVMDFPVRLLHGLSDNVVAPSLALDFANHIEGADVQAQFLKGEDHGFSSDRAMKVVIEVLDEMLKYTAK